jgi:hypothetical protein
MTMRPSQRGNVVLGGSSVGGALFGSSRRSSFSRGFAPHAGVAEDERTTSTVPSQNDKSMGGAASAASAIDDPVENEPSPSMEEITNASHIAARKQHQATITTTTLTSEGAATKMEENATLQRSFGNEIKGHSNHGDAATKSTPSTSSSEQMREKSEGVAASGHHRSDEAIRPSIRADNKRMSMITTTATSKAQANTPVDRRVSLSSSYRRPGNVAKPTPASSSTSAAAAARAGGAPKTPFHLRSHLTPVRISTKVEDAEVQATNDGYASVAKLSAWLADDPTKAKQRVKQIRRGANVIAKSRKFDKELANVKIIEADTLCRRGHVREKQHWLIEQQLAASDDDAASISGASHRTTSTTYGGLETSSAISVQDKKEWLANAFSSSQPPQPARAKTDVGSFQDDVEDVTLRAKQMWRKRTSTSASATTPLPQPKALSSSQWRPGQSTATKASETESATSDSASVVPSNMNLETMTSPVASNVNAQDSVSVASMPITSVEFHSVPPSLHTEGATGKDHDDAMSLWSLDHPGPDPEEKTVFNNASSGPSVRKETIMRSPPRSTPVKHEPASTDHSEPSPAQSARLMELQKIRSSAVVRKTADVFVRKDPEPEPEPDENDVDKVLSFQAARDLLISRSKQNGNALEVASKVSRRKAMFEKLQKDNRRKSMSHGHLKPSWKPDESGTVAAGVSISASKYKKTFVLDPVPKKSFEDLP